MAPGRKIDSAEERRDNDRRRLCVRICGRLADLEGIGYPFTMFIYTNYVGVGGKSISWAQLEQMRDAGVDIESHTVSHHDLRHAPKGQEYNAWLHNEIYTSKDILEQKLGIKIVAFAFPYGTHNEVVRKMATGGGVSGVIHSLWPTYGDRCCC